MGEDTNQVHVSKDRLSTSSSELGKALGSTGGSAGKRHQESKSISSSHSNLLLLSRSLGLTLV